MNAPNPVISSSNDRTRSWLILAGGLVVTAGLVVALISFWPSGDDEGDRVSSGSGSGWVTVPTTEATDTTGTDGAGEQEGEGEPSQTSTTAEGITTTTLAAAPSDLFVDGFPQAYADLLSASGSPGQVYEVVIYPTYAFLSYRDPAQPANLDRREWRDGRVGDAQANTIDDRVDADTEPGLFGAAELNPALIAGLVADAPNHYDIPTEVTHVIVNRFLPFDERVLIRVYATPSDGRSGGGYVSYDTAGTFVKVCC